MADIVYLRGLKIAPSDRHNLPASCVICLPYRLYIQHRMDREALLGRGREALWEQERRRKQCAADFGVEGSPSRLYLRYLQGRFGSMPCLYHQF